MFNKHLPVLLLAAVFILVVTFLSKGSFGGTLPAASESPTPKQTIKLGDKEILVELADTPEKRELGLGYRDSLPEQEGMLFVFGQKTPVRFWMKGMRIPLDMIFIADGKIVQIEKDIEPEPEVADIDLAAYVSNEPVEYVLEVNAGFSEKNNIQVGDSFSF